MSAPCGSQWRDDGGIPGHRAGFLADARTGLVSKYNVATMDAILYYLAGKGPTSENGLKFIFSTRAKHGGDLVGCCLALEAMGFIQTERFTDQDPNPQHSAAPGAVREFRDMLRNDGWKIETSPGGGSAAAPEAAPPPKPATRDDRLQTFTLYRFHDTLGRLLYIGISNKATRRWEEHAASKPWWTQVTDIRVEHFADHAAVLDAERAAIRAERPLYNHAHNDHKVEL